MPIAIKNDKADLSSEKQTEELALKFLNKLKPGNKVFLYGEMGVGKTTFVRYLINGFQKKNKFAKELFTKKFKLRVVKPKKGKGSFKRIKKV